MKSFRKYVLILTAAVMCFVLTGCKLIVNADIRYDLKGKGELSLLTGMDEELYNAAKEQGGDIDLSEFEKINIDGQTYYGTRIKTEFTDFDDLNSKMTSAALGDEFALFSEFKADKDGLYARPNFAYFGKEEFGQLQGMGVVIDMPLTVTTDGIITESNGTISDNKHTASWDMSALPEEITLKTRGSVGNILLIIGIILAGCAVLGGIVFLILHLVKNRNSSKKPSTYKEDPFADF